MVNQNLKVEVEASEAMETVGHTLVEEANKRIERGEDNEMIRSLHTIGREMIEQAREESEEDEEVFKETLYKTE